MNIENQFTQKGGARLDNFNATWPFAKLFVSREKVKLKVFSKEYEFEKNQIIGLREYNGILSKGMIIEHNKREYPHHMLFWTFSFKKLKKSVEILGHSVGPPKKSDDWWRGGP
jgi:hypothetical protein